MRDGKHIIKFSGSRVKRVGFSGALLVL
jgi:hypothetical protein